MAEYFIEFEDGQADLLTAAAYLGERIKSGDGHAEAMSAIVPRYLALGNVDLAAELANSVDDPFTRDRLLTEVAEKCAQLDDDEYALQLADSVEEFGLRSQALEHIALQKVQRGQVQKALEIAESMSHQDFVFAAAAARLAADGSTEESAGLLGRIEFPTAKISALQAMATSELTSGKKDESIELLEQAKQTAVEIEHNEERIRTLCDIGNNLVEAGRNDLAIGAFDTAREEAENLDNIHRDSFIAAAVIGFLRAGSVDTADRTLDLVTDKTQVANCLLAFANYYAAKGETEEAYDALDEAYQILRSQRDMETRDSRARFALFGQIAGQYAGMGKGDQAIETAQAIEDESYKTAALSQVSAILTVMRDDDHARHAVNLLGNDADRAFALIAISDAKQKNGDRADAAAVLDEAVHLIEEVPQLTARSSAYNEIAARYLQLGETTKVQEICSINLTVISQIRDESSRAATLASLSDIVNEGEVELTESDKQVVTRMLART